MLQLPMPSCNLQCRANRQGNRNDRCRSSRKRAHRRISNRFLSREPYYLLMGNDSIIFQTDRNKSNASSVGSNSSESHRPVIGQYAEDQTNKNLAGKKDSVCEPSSWHGSNLTEPISSLSAPCLSAALSDCLFFHQVDARNKQSEEAACSRHWCPPLKQRVSPFF